MSIIAAVLIICIILVFAVYHLGYVSGQTLCAVGAKKMTP